MTNVLKLTKKIFTVGVVATTIVWSLGVAALVPGVANAATCPTLTAGEMVKVTGKPAIYVVDNNLKVRYFDNGDIFKSWRPTYGGYTSITMDCLDSLGIPSVAPYGVSYHPGSYIVKRASSDQLYVVEPNNTLAKITPALATTLYGTGYKVMTITDQDWPNYPTRGADITEAKAHEGMLVKNNNKTWYVGAGTLQEVTEAGMIANGFQTKFVRTVADSVVAGLTTGTAITAEVKALTDKSQSGGVTGGVIVGTGSLSAALAADTPAAGTLASGSLYNKVLKVNVVGGSTGATVTGLTLTRSGLMANTAITGISVWDGTKRLGNIMTTLTSDGKVTVLFGNDKVVLGAGVSKSLTVALNFPTSTTSGTVNMSVAAATDIKTEGNSSVSGNFPIVGNTFSLADGSSSLGSIAVNNVSVGGLTWSTITSATGNLEVGDTNKEVAKFSFEQNNSKEAVQLEQLTVYVEGTFQESTDLANWQLVSPEGNVLATAEKSSDRYVKFVLTSPYVIDKGLTKNFSVKVDVKDGSSRYFRVSVQNDYDILVRGVTTGAYVMPIDSSYGTFDSADTQDANGGFLIKQGALTVSKSSSSPSTKTAPGQQNVVLAKFDLKSNGEALEVRKMRLFVKYASGQKDLTGTLSVKDSATGETYLSISADTASLQGTSAPTAYTSLLQNNLATYINIASGQTKTIEIIGSIDSTAGTSDTYTAYVGDFYVKRLSTNDYTNLAQSVYSANQIGVNSVTLTVNKDVSFPNSTKAQGSTTVKIGQYTVKASSADDVKVNTILIGIGGTSSTAAIQNLMLKNEGDGTQLGSTVGSPTVSNSFTVGKNITKDQTLTLGVYADILSSVATNGTVSSSIIASGISGYGINSNSNLSGVPASTVVGQTITAGAPTLTIKADANTVSSKIAIAGKTGVEVLKLNLEATRENLTLKKLTLNVASASTTNWSVADIAANFANVSLYDGGTLLASDKVESTNGTVTFTGLNVALTSDSQKVLTVKVDISDSGTMTPKSVARFQVYSTSTDYLEAYSTQGIMSTGITLTSNGAGNYALYTVSAPSAVWAGGAAATKLPNATDVVGSFTITNEGPRAITLSTTSVYIAASGLGVGGQITTLKLYDSEGNLVAASNNSVTITSSSASDTANFQMSTYNEIAGNGGTKTYVVKADTSAIRTGLTSSQNAYLSIKLDGSKGYDSTEVQTVGAATEEAYWGNGKIVYSYTNVSGGTTYSNLNASDTNPVEGVTYTY